MNELPITTNYFTHNFTAPTFLTPRTSKLRPSWLMFWKKLRLDTLTSTVQTAKPRQLLTTVLGAVATVTITVLSMAVKAITATGC